LKHLLFGDEDGKSPGDNEEGSSKFEQAQGGTIFLDSIGDLELSIQARLVRVICDRVVERGRGRGPVRVDARIIASTDKDLEGKVSSGQFERKLFDTLREFVISVPPLRDRKDEDEKHDDIPALAAMFLQRHKEMRRVHFSPEAVTLLRRYDYPGNVRELESAIKYALTMLSPADEIIRPEHLRPEIRQYELAKLDQVPKEETKNPRTILQVCPLNSKECTKKEEIIRLYSSRRVFVNVPNQPGYEKHEQVIRRTLEEYGLVPVLPKDDFEPVMMCNICKLIQTSKYGISDLSRSDINVLYRLGQIHSLGVQGTILKDDRTDQLTSLQGLSFLDYTDTSSLAIQLSHWIEKKIFVKEAGMSPIISIGSTQISSDERESLKRQLIRHQHNLNKLKEQAASYGAGQAPLHLLNQIEAEEMTIQELEEKLSNLA
jgi:hypothetical protein